MVPDRAALAAIELDVLLEALRLRHGRDLRGHARAAMLRRAEAFAASVGVRSVADLVAPALHDDDLAARLIDDLAPRPSELFRAPTFFRVLRDRLAPTLLTWPSVKAWVVACGTGEEAYSTAIVLAEVGLGARTTLYATDASARALAVAREGIYPVERVRQATAGYRDSGGTRPFAEYFRVGHGAAIVAPDIRGAVTWIDHDLAGDGAPGEMQLVVCRDVLIDLGRMLAERVVAVLVDGLAHGGFLCLGERDEIGVDPGSLGLVVVDAKAAVYKRVGRR